MAGMHIVILGPPGSGKGTQAARIAGELGIKHLSTGDLLREAVARRTELGVKAEGYMKSGLLVSDEVMLDLIKEELAVLGDSGWILDGFPRTLPQAEALSDRLEEMGLVIDSVILIDVDPEVIVERLTSRRVCPKCNAVYNLATLRAAEEGRCDRCGAELVKRPDDEEDTVRRRLQVYREQTEPVIEFYRGQGGLVTVSGAGDIDEITAEVLSMMK